jgi:phage terminase Nu1 subunit (DNA packaging protein)
MNTKTMTLKQLAAVMDCSMESIQRWRKNGMPAVGKTRPLKFDREAVRQWFLKNKKFKQATQLQGEAKGCEGKQIVEDVDQSKIGNMDEWVERVRYQECAAGLNMIKESKEKTDTGFWSDKYLAASEQRRKVEMTIAEIKLSQSNVVPSEEVERKFSEAAQLVKSRLQMLPDSISDRLVGLDAVEINKMLTAELELALEDMSR